ncbi:MAG TPA: competence type IV pilus minor pilin ComGF [Bacillaceae bacterium]
MKTNSHAWSDQEGFTLLEAIMGIFVLSIVVSLIPLMLKTFVSIDRVLTVEKDYEWNLFLIQFRKELNEIKKRHMDRERVYLDGTNLVITYEKYGSVIRRKVNDKGHEIVLQNVKSVLFYDVERGIGMAVEFQDGTREEARFFISEPEEEQVVP